MTGHDPLCPDGRVAVGAFCHCPMIATVRADEREAIAQELRSQGAEWVAEAARYRGYAVGSPNPAVHRSIAETLDQCGTSLLLSWAREYRKTRRVEAGKETSVQPGAIGPDAHPGGPS